MTFLNTVTDIAIPFSLIFFEIVCFAGNLFSNYYVV